MMNVIAPKSRCIDEVRREQDSLLLKSDWGWIRICVEADGIIRVLAVEQDREEHRAKSEKKEILSWIPLEVEKEWSYEEQEKQIVIRTEKMIVQVLRQTGAIMYYHRDGSILIRERERESKQLEAFEVYRTQLDENTRIRTIQTPDGAKKVIEQAAQVYDRTLNHTSIFFEIEEKEALYGLGQTEDGNLDRRNSTQYLYQSNRRIAVPFLVSTKGYGILINTEGACVYENQGKDLCFSCYAEERIDYYLIAAESMDGVVKGFRQITGKATMLPKWALGYVQSLERYESQQELVDTVREFRRRKIGLDAIVLDWLSWKDGMWGEKISDPVRFPSLHQMMRELHQDHAHFMVSIWPNMAPATENYKEMKEAGHILPGSEIYDVYDQNARELYWKQAQEGWYQFGIDGWWCDSSEDVTPEWNHLTRQPRTFEQWREFIDTAGKFMPVDRINAYGLYHAKGIYEGQRAETEEKRVMNLTRSGIQGSQRYGTVLWSGDIEASWDCLRRQIAAGLNFSASGIPYWTLDIGAFFVKKGIQWYWDGAFQNGTQDLGYQELYTRWYQFGAFLPMFRSHGTDCRREPWQFGKEGDIFYDAILMANRLRYQLMPYFYSMMGAVWREDASMIRLLAFDYAEDEKVYQIADQYLFGPSLMVCPVTAPMLYEAESSPVEAGEKKKQIYLPKGNDWYDFYTGERYMGGQTVIQDLTMDHIPLFVKAGAIIPTIEPVESTEEAEGRDITLWIYPGADGSFILYEDAGDGYGYEQGAYCITTITYEDRERKVNIDTKGEKQYRKGQISILVK